MPASPFISGWVLEVDIRSFFDTLDHGQLRTILRKRVQDGVLLHLIGKWLHAGVMEDGSVTYPDSGTPQGGVISPLLATVFLHEVLDTWFENEVQLRLKGRALLVRYADDVTVVFSLEADARRVWAVLPKRFARYGLTLHPEKTRLIAFRRPSGTDRDAAARPTSFDMLGFTHFWTRSLRGSWVIKRKTARDRLSRAPPGHCPVVSAASTRAGLLAARGALPETPRPLQLLRDHWELGGDHAVPSRSAQPVAEVVKSPRRTGAHVLGSVSPARGTLLAPRSHRRPLQLSSCSQPHDLKSRMR